MTMEQVVKRPIVYTGVHVLAPRRGDIHSRFYSADSMA